MPTEDSTSNSADDGKTVYTTSKKNLANTGGKGTQMPQMRQMMLQLQVPTYLSDGEVQQLVQQAIVDEIESRQQEDN